MTHEAYCNRCRARTTWTAHRRYSTCAGCRGRFPCAKGCGHADCRAERGETVPDAAGVLREKGEAPHAV